MTADDIKALVRRLRKINAHLGWPEYAEAIDALETLTLENQRLRVDATWAKEKLANGLDS